VDTAVLDELHHGPARDFAAHAVEGAHHDHAGGVVDDDIDAGRVLEGADVAAFAPDDASLHLVVRNVDGRDGRLTHVGGAGALDRGQHDFAAARVRLFLGLLDTSPDELVPLDGQLLLEPIEDLGLGLLAGEPGRLEQLGVDLFFALVEPAAPLGQGLLAVGELLFLIGKLAVALGCVSLPPLERVLLLGEPPFLATDLGAGRLLLLFERLAPRDLLVARGDFGLMLNRARLVLGLLDDGPRARLRVGLAAGDDLLVDPSPRDKSADQATEPDPDDNCCIHLPASFFRPSRA